MSPVAAMHKYFPATHASVWRENVAADEMGVPRIQTEQDLHALVQQNKLVPFDGLCVAKKLPKNRRYALPETVNYAHVLDSDFYDVFGAHLIVTSGVRPVSVQQVLRRHNRNAAPANGDRASSHERGTTIDISRHGLRKSEFRWLVARLMYDRALSRVMVIEERTCMHIFVRTKMEVL